MFRLQNNVPPIYVEQSRDFQLLCRLMDCSQGAVKYDTDTIINILDASTIRDSLLQLLCTKVGFFPKIDIDANILKYIVAAFPYLLKYKGTKLGIEYAVRAILKSEFGDITKFKPEITIYNSKDEINKYTIYISSNLSDYSRQALEEVLNYVKPIGYSYTISDIATLKSDSNSETILGFKDAISTFLLSKSYLGTVADNKSMYIGNNIEPYIEISDNNLAIYGNTIYGNVYGGNVTGNGTYYRGDLPRNDINPLPAKEVNIIDPRYIGYGMVVNQEDIDFVNGKDVKGEDNNE